MPVLQLPPRKPIGSVVPGPDSNRPGFNSNFVEIVPMSSYLAHEAEDSKQEEEKTLKDPKQTKEETEPIAIPISPTKTAAENVRKTSANIFFKWTSMICNNFLLV